MSNDSGQIVVLSGSSSAGTTTVARALQDALAEPYPLLGVDTSRLDPAACAARISDVLTAWPAGKESVLARFR